MAVLPRLLPLLLLLLAASSAALLAINAHSSCPGPLAIPCIPRSYSCHFRSALWACESAHLFPRTELARLLALVFPSRSEGSGAGNRSAGDPQASRAAHWLRTLQRSIPKRAWPPAPRRAEGSHRS